MEILLILSTIIFAIVVNILRSILLDIGNRSILNGLFLIYILWISSFDMSKLPLLFLAFVVLMSISYHFIGGIIAAIVSVQLINYLGPNTIQSQFPFLPEIFLTTGIVIGVYFHYRKIQLSRQINIKNQLHEHIRNQTVSTAMSLSLQETLEIKNVLHILLTGITAGYGLGFNRAFVFLYNELNNTLEGTMGIGPLNKYNGMNVWIENVDCKTHLNDYIYIDNPDEIDADLNSILKTINFPIITSDGVLSKCFLSQDTIICQTIDKENPYIVKLNNYFSLETFACVPLIKGGKCLGIIVIDNIVHDNPITMESLEPVFPIATQAALAIENAMLYKITHNNSITDSLTNLYNKRYFHQAFVSHCSTHANNTPLSLIMVDVDDFKMFNDKNGHVAGDQLLHALGYIVKENCRYVDIPCRFGGEEFAILLPNASLSDAMEVAESIQNKMKIHQFSHGQEQPKGRITLSIGIASYPTITNRPEELIACADAALYKAKNLGKNQIYVYGEEVSA